MGPKLRANVASQTDYLRRLKLSNFCQNPQDLRRQPSRRSFLRSMPTYLLSCLELTDDLVDLAKGLDGSLRPTGTGRSLGMHLLGVVVVSLAITSTVDGQMRRFDDEVDASGACPDAIRFKVTSPETDATYQGVAARGTNAYFLKPSGGPCRSRQTKLPDVPRNPAKESRIPASSC